MSELNREQERITSSNNELYNYVKRIVAAVNYKGDCDHEDVPSILREFINGYEQKIKELTEDVKRVSKQCGEIIVECDERDAERLKQVAELTVENERLRADVAKEFTCVFGTPHKVSDCPIDDEVAKARADTVRKMRTALIANLSPYSNYTTAEVCDLIDQIEKEMLEMDKVTKSTTLKKD